MLNKYESGLVHAIDAELASCVSRSLPAYVREPLEYCLSRAAKRLRALTVLHSCSLIGGDAGRALPAAAAVELVHNFTLVHDDMMDGDRERRGAASVHARFGSARALLAGDALLALSLTALGKLDPASYAAALPSFTAALSELCRGQALDHEFETAANVDFDAYLDMTRAKTGTLFELACTLGGRCAGASEEDLQALTDVGKSFGVAYQLRDDWKDFFAAPTALGKRPGSDHRRRKKTCVEILSRFEGAPSPHETVVPFAFERRRLQRAGVDQRVESEVRRHVEQALTALLRTRPGADASALWGLVQRALTPASGETPFTNARSEAG